MNRRQPGFIRQKSIGFSGGFSAVELMITLFIAAAFVITGYQLYSVIISDGGAARARAKASNIAYDYLRRYAADSTIPCTTLPTVTPTPPGGSGLSNPVITVSYSCPYGTSSTITNVTVVVQYGTSPRQEVTHELYYSE